MTLDFQTPNSHPFASSPFKKAIAYLSLVLLGAGATFTGSYFLSRHSDSLEATAIPTSSETDLQVGIAPAALPPSTEGGNFVTATVEEVGPAVVRINASRNVLSQLPDALSNPRLRQFFGSQLPDRQQRVERGTGSGFIISADGQILTNAHVVEGADRVEVVLQDGRRLEGEVLGTDSVTDVAVIKVEAENLPTVSLGDSDRLRPGEWAIAIGNPLGLDSTVTTGIISATGRSSSEVGVPDKRVEFIQTDAAINPGNSGGPLLNASGEAIGMNTAIIQGAQGLGFAIPINTAQRIAEQLIATGKADHPFLGIEMVALTPELKDNINANPNAGFTVEEERGVLIARVLDNSPADRAGFQAGDIIVAIEGEPITDASDVQQAVAQAEIGSELKLELRRDRQTVVATVRPGELPTER
jgi:S1-C subfamily serine protease